MMMITSQKLVPDAEIICQQNLNVDVSAPSFESIPTESKALINNTGAPACGRRWNWFTKSYEATQEILKTEGEKEMEQADANKENPEPGEEEEEEEEEEIKEPEEEKEDTMTLREYEKLLKEKRKPLQLLRPLEERKVDTRDQFTNLQPLKPLGERKVDTRDQFTKLKKKKKKNKKSKEEEEDKKDKEDKKGYLRRRWCDNGDYVAGWCDYDYEPGSIGYKEALARAEAKKLVLSAYGETRLLEDEREYPILGSDPSKRKYGVSRTSLRLKLLSLGSI